jgi:hypothetical protein
VRERAARPIGGRDSYFQQEVQFFTPREGVNTVRFMPPPPDADWGGHYGFPIAVHYDIGADGSAYLCRNKMLGEPCAICDERTAASAANEEELVKALRAGNRVAAYVIDRKDESKGVQLWNMAEGVDKDVTKICVDASTGEVIYPEDPEHGYDLTFTREGTGLKTKYKGLVFSRRESPLSDDAKLYEAWLKYVVDHPINNMLLFHDTEYVSKVLSGQPTGAAAPAAQQPQQAQRPAAAERRPLARRAAPPPPPAATTAADAGDDPAAGDLPSWDDLLKMNDEDLSGLATEFQLVPPKDGFGSEEELRDWVAKELQIEKPAPAPVANAKPAAGNWRDRLKQAK